MNQKIDSKKRQTSPKPMPPRFRGRMKARGNLTVEKKPVE